MKKLNTKMIAMCGILTAMTIVLAEFFGINLAMIQISFNFIPIVFAAMYLGPIPCCIIAALADFVGALLFQGSVNPFITIISALTIGSSMCSISDGSGKLVGFVISITVPSDL